MIPHIASSFRSIHRSFTPHSLVIFNSSFSSPLNSPKSCKHNRKFTVRYYPTQRQETQQSSSPSNSSASNSVNSSRQFTTRLNQVTSAIDNPASNQTLNVSNVNTLPIITPQTKYISSPPTTFHNGLTASTSLLQASISNYARQPQRGVTLKQLLAVGKHPTQEALIDSAMFLYKELPIRLAKRVKELDSLPYGLSQTAPVQKVKSWYCDSFRDILSQPEPRTVDAELAFTALLERILLRHKDVVPTMAQGILQMKRELGSSGDDIVHQCPFLLDFLNRFYSSRIGIRLLISQHCALHHPSEDYIGTIAVNVSPLSVINQAISDASRICEREYGYAPDVNVTHDSHLTLTNSNNSNNNSKNNNKIDIAFVPSHLHHICFELLKNSMRAVVEHHGINNYDAPPIEVAVADSVGEFAVKVSDLGGGIARSDMSRIWSYLYTTIKRDPEELLNSLNTSGTDPSQSAPMAGFGYGLPISRCYVLYFGGDLQIVSVPTHGTDAFLYLNKLNDYNLFLD